MLLEYESFHLNECSTICVVPYIVSFVMHYKEMWQNVNITDACIFLF